MMDNKIFFSATFFTLILLSVLFSFSLITAIAAPTNVTFTVNLTLGNDAPFIPYVDDTISANPTESSTTDLYILFNASDNNGHTDIDYTTAQVTVSQSGEQQRTSSSCVNYQNDTSTNTKSFNCTVSMQYFDNDGVWTINATVDDAGAQTADNDTETLTYGTLYAVRGNINGITFGSINLGDNAESTNDPLILNNTGNQNFTEINITAYNLEGTPATEYIPAANITVNASGNGFGQWLLNSSVVTINNAELARDVSGVDTNVSLYFWVKVPSSGLSNQDYISDQDWTIQVFS